MIVSPGTQVTPVRALGFDCAKSSPIAHHTRLRMLQKQNTAACEAQIDTQANVDELCKDSETIATLDPTCENVSDEINSTLNYVVHTVANLENTNITSFRNEILDAISNNSNIDHVNHSGNALGDDVRDNTEHSEFEFGFVAQEP
ncbi:hypothetical protein AVEN_28271-1 [Araneus ventricosus]|uniref:Uncharacterized protein n=1 Tax=Araneus ventricosus TaxID=182803 RepID=A0A4Y2T5D7_ARAVE|nr:hypothetical protein AVEN_28271-1 [Araneus ventricosus]